MNPRGPGRPRHENQSPPENSPSGAAVESGIPSIDELLGCGDIRYYSTVSKFDNPSVGNDKVLCKKSDGVPTLEEIHAAHGGGRFLFYVYDREKSLNAQKVYRIAENFNGAAVSLPEAQTNSGVTSFVQTLEVVLMMMDRLKEILAPAEKDRSPVDLAKEMMALVSTQTQMASASVLDGLRTTTDIARAAQQQIIAAHQEAGKIVVQALADAAAQQDDEEEDEQKPPEVPTPAFNLGGYPVSQQQAEGLAQQVIEMIEPNLPAIVEALFGDSPIAKTIAINSVKAFKQFQQIQAQPDQLAILKAWVCEQTGTENAEKLFSALNV